MFFSKAFLIAGLGMVAYSRPAPAPASITPAPDDIDDTFSRKLNHGVAWVKEAADVASSVLSEAHASGTVLRRDLSATPTSTSAGASPTALDTQPTQPTTASDSTSVGSTQPVPSGSRPSTTVQAQQPTARSVPEYYYR
ncbi:hypothetical protein BDP27DRAFT_1422743 [Rhodocollybia butyracea]|uniref:Uncharacterized protein n=1 Tax=Rhodocollybia butyracea TaxID=206335 RepID=A0A9P5PTB7_9AGAR|nr:hypothetical protein BDP27DRAFT_1422743 [Rhodocollybia butyracea]